MKKNLFIFASAIAVLCIAACNPESNVDDPNAKALHIHVFGNDSTALTESGIAVALAEKTGSATFNATTDANGVATFKVPFGSYKAKVAHTRQGKKLVGASDEFAFASADTCDFEVYVREIKTSSLILKEVMSTGTPADEGDGSTTNDSYLIVYNNTAEEVDASNLQIGFLAPYNANGTNKYYGEGSTLKYEKEDWIPSYGAVWCFKTTSTVKIPAYSQIVIACFSAIDMTQTFSKSVDLSKAEYYWMSKNDQYTHAKYTVSDNIPEANYMVCTPFTKGTSWALSISAPAVFIGADTYANQEARVADPNNYDTTLGTDHPNKVIKYPKDKVLDVVEVWSEANVNNSNPRFSADLNIGYVAITNKHGYTVYRNVDKDATEALPENAGKLVYDYAGGAGESTDPSGIDAEASIKNGAHIVYMDTNDSAADFHIRKVSSLK